MLQKEVVKEKCGDYGVRYGGSKMPVWQKDNRGKRCRNEYPGKVERSEPVSWFYVGRCQEECDLNNGQQNNEESIFHGAAPFSQAG